MIIKKVKGFFVGTYPRLFVTMYALLTLSGAILLKLPISVRPGQTLSFTDSFFISISGISTTGLSTVDVGEVLTTFGQIVLLFYLQVGGIGIMLLLASYWILSGKRIGVRERTMLLTEQNQSSMEGILKLVKYTIMTLLFFELLSVVVLGTYLLFAYPEVYSLKDAYFTSLFSTVSTLTNAGFDIDKMTSYTRFENDMYFQFHSMFLMFIGAVGFWPLVETVEMFKCKRKGKKFKYSHLSRLLFKLHLYIWIISAGVYFALEYNASLAGKTLPMSIVNSLFMSLTTRNAGFTIVGDLHVLQPATLLIFMILMVVGSSPNSVGGGIRTTSVAVAVKSLWSFAIGREQVVIQNKAVKMDTIRKSLLIILGGTIIVLTATFIMLIAEPDFAFEEILFEVTSAFGTTGLSLGITGSLSIISKITLIFVMFIGRVGVLALLLMIRDNKFDENKIRYPEGDIMVG